MRLLVKANPAATQARLGIGGSPALALSPLMPAIDAARAGPEAWHATAPIDERANPWDLCHALVRDGLGFAGGGDVAIAEPDLEQHWVPAPARDLGFGFGSDRGSDCGRLMPQSPNYPQGPADGWFADADHSGLAEARAALGAAAPGLRIAHLDTGYDPNHRTKPARLRQDLALNFADPLPSGQPSPGAQDRKTAEVNPMFGHGTATLALLAGEPYGGARGFEVVPLRVANWVVLFRNSSIAAALDHVLTLSADPATRCDVLSMSMGGLASAAWADAVNALYEAGVVLVTAAGNNYGNLPVRSIVYPARFNRVLAACGIMANGRPYADLAINLMAGCYGPASKMRTALSAWTPNVPWARFGCPDAVDQDGGGTSAATPQVAAAAALWLQRHGAALAGYPGWARVEAVRQALFATAGRAGAGTAPDGHLGRGVLRAAAALGSAPAALAALRPEAPDAVEFAVLRLLAGLGIAPEQAAAPAQRMLELEAVQLTQRSAAVAAALGERDPAEGDPRDPGWTRALLAMADDPACSAALRGFIRGHLAAAQVPGTALPVPDAAPAAAPHGTLPPGAGPPEDAPPLPPAAAIAGCAATPRARRDPLVPVPVARRLRVFASDPAAATLLRLRGVAVATIAVDWEPPAVLQPGPVGEYLEVIDVDPACQRAYAPVNLNQPEILAQDGLPPSEGSPQFHQQMAYAVAMKTIGHFRGALGREPFWADRVVRGPDGRRTHRFVRRLRIYPHGLREPNAYYSPDRMALLFGYFRAARPGGGTVMQDGMIFTCLAFDIVAHETTHALLDGLHPRWKVPTGLDAPAFHEAFADLVALFQHFTLAEALVAEIRRARGQLRLADSFGALAKQFGEAIGGHGALRDAVGQPASPADYQTARQAGPHALGAVLVAAVFEAWLQVYEERSADLFRLATNGTGVLPAGEIPHDLAQRLAGEAAKLAGHFLNICIRALDYCPPVDITLGEYLRAMITADRDLVEDDPRGYRVALVDGFRQRGIRPPDVQTWSPAAMVWEEPEDPGLLDPICETLEGMVGSWQLNGDRLAAWKGSRRDAAQLQVALMRALNRDRLLRALGLLPPPEAGDAWRAAEVDGAIGQVSPLEVHSVRPLRRVGPDGQVLSAVVIEITQAWKPAVPPGAPEPEAVRGGCTIIWDRTERAVRYVVYKRVGHRGRTEAQQALRLAVTESGSTRGNYDTLARTRREPFALLHAGH